MSSPVGSMPRRPLVSHNLLVALALTLPALALTAVFKVIPLAQGFLNSLHRKGEFIGLANYERMLSDGIWMESVGNSLKGFLLLPLFVLLPLLVAFALFRGVRGWRTYRAVYLLSYLLPAAMAGLIFSLLLGYEGPVNSTLRTLGLGQFAVAWFSDPSTAMWAVYAIVFWAWFGLGTIIYLAALGAISEEQFEAARLDGASGLQMFRHLAIPGVAPTVGYWAVLTTAGLFLWLFPFIMTSTRGGPGYASTTPEVRIYSMFTKGQNQEYAAALGLTLFVIVLVICVFQVRWMYSHANEHD